jgi:hypothetical protein
MPSTATPVAARSRTHLREQIEQRILALRDRELQPPREQGALHPHEREQQDAAFVDDDGEP